MKLNEAQETVKIKIMMNPLNRMKVRDAAKMLYRNKIKNGIEHNGEPLLGTLRGLIWEEGKELSMEDLVALQVAMYLEELKIVQELELA